MALHILSYPQTDKNLKHLIPDGSFYFYIEISFMVMYTFFIIKIFGTVIGDNGLLGKAV